MGVRIMGPGTQIWLHSPVALVKPDLGGCRPSRRTLTGGRWPVSLPGILQLPSCCLFQFNVPTVLAVTCVQVWPCLLGKMYSKTVARSRDGRC